MSRTIDLDQPLSDEDKLYLHERSRDWEIAENERRFNQEVRDDGVDPDTVKILSDAGNVPPDAPNNPLIQPPPVLVPEPEGDSDQTGEDVIIVGNEEYVESLTDEEVTEELDKLGEATSGDRADQAARLVARLNADDAAAKV